MARIPATGTRPYVALHTMMLNNAELLIAGDAARLLVPVLLMLSAQQGTEGVVPSDPRLVNVIARLDGGVPATKEALDALREMRFLVDGDEPGTLRIRNWLRFQAEFRPSETRAESNQKSSLSRWHSEGKHESAPRENCPECKSDGAPCAVPAEVHAPAGKKLTAKETGEFFRSAFPAVFENCESRLDGYRQLLTVARDIAEENATLSPNLAGSLTNSVLADALEHYLDLPADQLPRAYKGAKALSAQDGAYWWILAAQESAGRELVPGKVLSYVQAVAASKRSTWLAGSAA